MSMTVASTMLLLVSAFWAAPAFVLPGVRFTPAAGQVAEPGSAAVQRPTMSGAAEKGLGLGLGFLAPLGVACFALGVVAMRSERRASPVARLATSYKDYNDPWLGSADLGFDPLNVAIGSVFDKGTSVKPETTYYNYRESEVKHGRFAMVAFLAIFFEAADRSAVLRQLGNQSATDNLDGTLGLDEVQAPVLLVGLGIQALAEFNLQKSENDGSYLTVEYNPARCPGDLGFDPLGLATGVKADKKGLHNVEVNVGRLAMIGVTSFLFKEFVVKDPAIASKIL